MVFEKRLMEFENYLSSMTTSSPKTITKYRAVLRMFLYENLTKLERPNGELSLSINDVNTWLAKRNKEKATGSYKYAMQHFFNSIGRQDLSAQLVPAKTHPRLKVFKFIPKAKLEQMINALPSKYRPIAFLQIKTGARIGSVLTLRSENIDFNMHPNLIYIKIGIGKSKSKRNKELNLKISKKYEPFIRKLMKRPYGYMFLSEDCEKMAPEEVAQKVDTLIRYYDKELSIVGNMFGIDHFASHYLRHLFADYFLNAGGDPVYLKDALGHSKLDTTLRYISITDKKVDEAIIAMENN